MWNMARRLTSTSSTPPSSPSPPLPPTRMRTSAARAARAAELRAPSARVRAATATDALPPERFFGPPLAAISSRTDATATSPAPAPPLAATLPKCRKRRGAGAGESAPAAGVGKSALSTARDAFVESAFVNSSTRARLASPRPPPSTTISYGAASSRLRFTRSSVGRDDMFEFWYFW